MISDSAMLQTEEYATLVEKAETLDSLMRKVLFIIRFILSIIPLKKKFEKMGIEKAHQLMEREAWRLKGVAKKTSPLH